MFQSFQQHQLYEILESDAEELLAVLVCGLWAYTMANLKACALLCHCFRYLHLISRMQVVICEAKPTGQGDVDMKPVLSYYLPSVFGTPDPTFHIEGWLSNGSNSVKMLERDAWPRALISAVTGLEIR